MCLGSDFIARNMHFPVLFLMLHFSSCQPGIILTIVHSMALGYSAMIIIIERNEGLLDRTWVAGVTAGEFALAHFIVSLVVNLLQVIVTLVFMILIFQVRSE